MMDYMLANRRLKDLFSGVLARLPEPAHDRIKNCLRVTPVSSDEQFRALVGHAKTIAWLQRRVDGTWRLVINLALASWPDGAIGYVLAHELAHVVQDTADELAADQQVIRWGFQGEMEQAAIWGRLLAVGNPELSYQPTQVMRETLCSS